MKSLRRDSLVYRALWGSAFFAIYVLWGGTFLARQVALRSIPPFLESSFRFLIAGFVMGGIAGCRREPFLDRPQIFSQVRIGLLLLLGGTGLVSWAQQFVASGTASLFVASVPMWMVLVDWVWNRGAAPSWRVLAGLCAGFFGILMLTRTVAGGSQSLDLAGAGVLLLASFSWAAGSVYAKRTPPPASDLYAISLQMLSGGLSLLIAAFISGQTSNFSFSAIRLESWSAMFYLVFFGSMAGFTAYQWLLRETSPAVVATHAYINPLIAVIAGGLLLHEPMTMQTGISAGFILLSVALIVSSSPRVHAQDREPFEIH